MHGNCLFSTGFDDAWAAFVLEPSSYAWLDGDAKRGRLLALIGAIEALQADVQILRIASPWTPEHYVGELGGDAKHARARRRYVEEHRRRLSGAGPARARVFLLVSLSEPGRDLAAHLSLLAAENPRSWWRALKRALALADRRFLRIDELADVHLRASQALACARDFLSVREATGGELQWLVRRAFCRGLGEPVLDGLHEPRALLVERNGRAQLAPLEGDVLRWAEGCVEHRVRLLRIESEQGTSWQSNLVLGALPDRVRFPGARAELMSAPLEALPFAVDVSLNARFVPNGLAVRLVRRRIQDADQVLRAEAGGEQGVSDAGYERTQEARELLGHLQAPSRPPLLRATLAIAVSASDEETLERRIEGCRRAFGEVRLHRPLGDQLQLFVQHLPGQRTRVAGYEDMLTTEQVAAMMPTATHTAGSRRGFYLGHTLSASRQPVRFNLREGSDGDSNTTILSVGALGSGKTTLAQKLLYEAFLQGARVVDCDPKGDHGFHLLEDVSPHVQSVTLRPDPALRGMLDPLRVAPSHLRQDAAVSFLCELLPARADPAWETAVLTAVDRVVGRSREPTCGEVVHALREGDEDAARVGAALEVHSRSGLTQLGFADATTKPPATGGHQVTYLPIRDLPAPDPDVPRGDYSQSERVGAQIVRLIAMFAAHVMSAERSRLKIFAFDEGWRLLGDPVGRRLVAGLLRMGRSELAVPIISTQLVTDGLAGERDALDNLIGATFVFGMRSPGEAGRALALLGLDPEDRAARQTLLEMERGRCLFRDHRGRVEAIQVELAIPALLRSLSTTPTTA